MGRRRAVYVALLLWIGSLPAQLEAGALVRVAPESAVRGDEILLSDLATIEGDAISVARLRSVRLGPAPPPGSAQQLDPDYLRLRLRQLSADLTAVQLAIPARVTVTRASQVQAAAAIVEVARRDALARLEAVDPQGGPHALTSASRPGDLLIPAGRVELVAQIQLGAPPYAFVAATVTVRVDGRDYQNLPLTFRVGRLQSVVVAAHTLEPKTVLSESDFRLERRPSTELPPGALTALPEARDTEAVRSLKAGDVVTDGLVRAKVLVKRGEIVTLVLEGQGFRITTVGQAGEDARRGDALRVVNLTSKREVLGRAEGPGFVRVPFGTPRSER
jgi:flagella basal body P-ring formation protein FlgA